MATQTPRVFTAEMSYHKMLMHGQGLAPSLLYILCAVLLSKPEHTDADTCSFKGREFQSERFRWYFNTQRMQLFTREVFHDFTVKVSDHGEVMAETAFINWLESLQMKLDDKNRSVPIPL